MSVFHEEIFTPIYTQIPIFYTTVPLVSVVNSNSIKPLKGDLRKEQGDKEIAGN